MADLKILDLPEGAPAQGTDAFPIARSAVDTRKLSLSAITAFFTGSFASLTHATRHQNGGADEINVAGLSGLLADPQTPTAHAASHQDGGGDELNVTGLTGVLGTPQTPAAHKVTHQVGGTDEIAVTGLTGLLATPQTPVAHKTSHQNGGADEIDVTGLSGVLADPQTPVAHAASHADGGGDELSVAGLSGQLADAQKITVRKNNGADVGTRSRLNFVEGPNVTLTVVDDSGSGEIDVTIESTAAGGGGGTVTTTGTPASGNLTKFSGATAITNGDLSGDVTTTGTLAATVANDAVTYAKMQNVSAASKLLGRGDSGSGDPQEITLGANLTMTGTTLAASGGGGTTPTGTGFRHITAGVEDAAAKLVDTADINNSQVTYAKMQTIPLPSLLLGRGSTGSGDVQEIALGTNLSMTGTVLNAAGGGGSGTVTTTGTPVAGQVALVSGGTSITGDAELTYDAATDTLTNTGLTTLGTGGTATLGASTNSFAVAGNNGGPTALVRLESTAAGVTAERAALALVRTTAAADMADAFGVRQEFILRDQDGVDNVVARLRAQRDGADNSGKFSIQTAVAGTFTDRLIVAGDGALTIGCYHAELAPLAINTTTAETTLYSFTIAANALSTFRKLRVTIRGNILANSGTPTFTFRVKLGATTLWGDATPGLGAMATRASFAMDFVLSNLNATNAQAVQGTFFASNRAAAASIAGIGDIGAVATLANPFGGTAAEDSTAALTLAVTVQPSVNNVNVEVLRQIAFAELIG